MRKDNFLFETTRIRLLEKTLFQPQIYERMVDAADYEQSLRVLQETRYSKYITDQRVDYDEILRKELNEQAQQIIELAKDPDLIEFLFLSYTIHNLKVYLKKEYDSNVEAEDLEIFEFSALSSELLQDWIKNPSKNPKETMFQKSVFNVTSMYSENRNVKESDLMLDQLYFEELDRLARKMKNSFLKNYVQNYADFTNVSIFLRSRHQHADFSLVDKAFVPGGRITKEELRLRFRMEYETVLTLLKDHRVDERLQKAYVKYIETKKISEFEKAKDQYYYAVGLEATKSLYGPEVIFGYFSRVETELKNIRIILSGKKAEVSASAIRERIRRDV